MNVRYAQGAYRRLADYVMGSPAPGNPLGVVGKGMLKASDPGCANSPMTGSSYAMVA
jgi:hypothetical protein